MIERRVWEVSWGSLWKIFFFVVLAAIMVTAQQVLMGLFLAIVISSGLEFLVNILERRGVPRTLGVIFIFVACILLGVIVAYWVIPLIVIDINTIVSGVTKSASGSSWLAPLAHLQDNKSVSLFLSKISSQLFSGDFSPLTTLSDILGGVGLALAVVVSSFYLSLTHDGVERFIRAVLPDEVEPTAIRIYERSRRAVGHWFRSQIVLSFTMGVLVWGSMALLGVKHAFVLGILAAAFEIVPFVGPILSGAVAVVSALTTSSALALWTVVIFIIIQQLENHLIVPLLSRKLVGLHPVIVIIAILIGLQVAGILGALISVPAAAVLQEVLEELTDTRKTSRAMIEEEQPA